MGGSVIPCFSNFDMKKTLILFFCFTSFISVSQNRNSIWCLGDSAGIDFTNINNPQPIHTAVKSRGSCVSVSDSIGNLLFYAYTRATVAGNTTLVINSNDVLMQNGSNVIGRGWYQELVIVSDPGNSNRYYLFCVGVTSIFGLYYSIIDMNLDSGRGEVILKNQQLQSYQSIDCITAIKHGNGRDWWILSKKSGVVNNEFYEYLVSPSGVSGPFIQSVGTPADDGFYRMLFNKAGNTLTSMNYSNLIENFNFDRCTGTLTYQTLIAPEVNPPLPSLWSCELSPNERYLYISINNYTSYLFQLDLQDVDPWANKDTLWTFDLFPAAGGGLKLAPDNKIYFACAWSDSVGNFNYPYPDSVFNIYNNNLSVINNPDSPGVACGFAPFSFNLGAGRTYWGLPNNPDYEMGPDTNSMCDTLTAVATVGSSSRQESRLNIFYHPGWQITFINAEGLSGKKYSLAVYDLTGREVYREEGALHGQYFTRDVSCEQFASGMYVVSLSTNQEILTKKFIKPAGR